MAHSVVMNSLLEGEGSAGEQAVIEHSHLEGAWSIGRASFVSQIHSFTDLAVADAIAVQEVAVGAGSCVLICYGVHDAIKEQIDRKHKVSRFKFQTLPVYQNGLPIVIPEETAYYDPDKRCSGAALAKSKMTFSQ